VIKLRFGLSGRGACLALEEIARQINMTPERAGQANSIAGVAQVPAAWPAIWTGRLSREL